MGNKDKNIIYNIYRQLNKYTNFKSIDGYVAYNNCTRCKVRAFFYKNTLYKNVQDENGQKVKNVLRISSS